MDVENWGGVNGGGGGPRARHGSLSYWDALHCFFEPESFCCFPVVRPTVPFTRVSVTVCGAAEAALADDSVDILSKALALKCRTAHTRQCYIVLYP